MEAVFDSVVNRCRRSRQDTLATLRRWVLCNSYTRNVDGVNQMGELLANDFAVPGLTLTRQPGDSFGDHLVWRTRAWDSHDPAHRWVLVGHHDTVFPPGTFEVWQQEGDVLRGPGVLDMKGGLAVIHLALTALGEAGLLEQIPLAVVSVADEEIGSPESRPMLQELASGARGALVFEGGRAKDAIITRRKGTGAMVVESAGRAAHAGNHHGDGINAVWALARFIDRVQRLTDYDRGLTVNVGIVSGGDARNTVPGLASCEVDLRFEEALDGEAAVTEMTAIAAELGAETGAILTLNGGVRRLPLERSERSVALFRQYATCADASGLGSEEAALVGGGSDANTVSAVGVPAIDGLGPRGSGFHTHDETIEVSTLPMKAEALVRLLWPGAADD